MISNFPRNLQTISLNCLAQTAFDWNFPAHTEKSYQANKKEISSLKNCAWNLSSDLTLTDQILTAETQM